MRLPIIIVNFKAYESAVGNKAQELVGICEKVSKEMDVSIAVCVQATDLFRISQITSIPVIAEHIDPVNYGSHTGAILPEAVLENGAKGTLINHSERRVTPDVIRATLGRARELGIYTIVCSKIPSEAAEVAGLNPDMIAIEPPELIGGDVSVTTADPSIVSDSVAQVKQKADIPVVCGAGVKDGNDVRKALELGASGVLVASGITRSDDPESALRDMAKGL